MLVAGPEGVHGPSGGARMILWREVMTRNPAEQDDIIRRDPAILGGRPVFRGTRVPVDVVFDNLADGLALDEILASYPTLDREDVLRVLSLAKLRVTADAA
jgi:uncharacterized protein (DUF433 family)